MNVLVACEESQAVCKEFRKKGYTAYSCDLLECSGKTMPSWYAEAWHLPKEERAKLRSKTFPGIAKAMAEQWG